MTYIRFKWSITGLFALVAASAAMAPGSAQAQSPCYYYDTFSGSYVSAYSECNESASGTSAVGANLSAIGEGFVQQQLNIGFGGFTSPTGRLRHTEHDGLTEKSTGIRTNGFEIDEGSVFANGSYDLPGTYFGGKVRVNGLLGYNRLSLDLDRAPGDVTAGKTDIDAFIYGGSYLWSQGSFYSMTLIIGVSGDADAIDSLSGGRYSYDLSGYFSNSVMGYTFDWPGNGWKFDLRGALGHYDIHTDRFAFANGLGTIKGVSEAWSGSITGTLFTVFDYNGGTMRPYILASYKNVFDEDIKVKGDFVAEFEQANDFGKVEVGFDYVQGILTYGAAGYTEFSSDESTFGGRLGVSIKLQ
ncbi:MAG: hypothetical protein JNN24_17085 [Hyphomicrobium zavarzinii]|jgi:hypothetical protein|uniref:hypothetical protein n=1 Tax=Hyphomicrobium TaxID=81 RepID=UPI0003780444|nr:MULTISPECIES: hypothetical protein [Hyphomicrobium]MBL8847481.1 hypothetical protein [Hyphomicrobium zavarzinii]WBT36211.1 hypothetical protein PE058_11095 [Hyphomicrobium sp. DMF-1]HML41377.1 hypothetical protein [Hyphomicrobium zavarzinii]